MRLQIPLLQRYVFGELVRTFCFVLICLTVLLVFVGVFQQASQSGLGPLQLLRILPYIIPSLLPFTIPAALLLTVSLVYGRLAGDLEITAAKAAGISVMSLLWPSFIVGAALSVLSLVLSDQAIPWAMGHIQQTIVSAMEDILLERLRTERQFGDRGRGLHVSVVDVKDRRLIQPVFSYRHGDEPATMWADEATIDLDLKHDEAIITLTNGVVDLPGQDAIYLSAVSQRIPWETDNGDRQPRHLPIREIERELASAEAERGRETDRMVIEAAFSLTQGDFSALTDRKSKRQKLLKDNRQRTLRLDTEMHSRYALACSCLFFVLVGSPLAVLKAQSRFLTSFLYCFVPIVTGYYPVVLGLMTQAKKGHIDPAWAMWVGNAALVVVATSLIRRVRMH